MGWNEIVILLLSIAKLSRIWIQILYLLNTVIIICINLLFDQLFWLKNAIIIILSLIRTVGWNSNSNTGSQVNSREAKSSDSFSAVSCFTTKQTRGTRPLYKPIGFNLDQTYCFCMFQSCPFTYMRKHRLWRIFVPKTRPANRANLATQANTANQTNVNSSYILFLQGILQSTYFIILTFQQFM